jgi:hypothetical protein
MRQRGRSNTLTGIIDLLPWQRIKICASDHDVI